MKRVAALALGVPVILVAGLALGPGDVRAGEENEGKVGTKVEKKVVVRHAGGGRLGVSLDDTEGDVRGAKVRSVEAGSPAEKAGIKEGDVIARFDGEAVRSAAHLARLVGETPAGRSVAIEVARGGATQKLSATLAEGKGLVRIHTGEGFPGLREFSFDVPHWELEAPEPPEPPDAPSVPHAPAPPRAPRAPMPHAWSWKGGDMNDMVFRMFGGGPRKLGVEYIEIGEQLAAHFKLAGKTGVLVTSVDADGPAGKAGIKAGDVILKLGPETVEDGEDLREAVAEAEGGKETTVTVQRDGRPLDLKITPAKPETKVRRRSAGVSL
jgi:membrane-associated protease RseP (regulator of RpoE activity)